MKKLLLIGGLLLILTGPITANAWVFVNNYGDTGWQTYSYQAGPEGFTGKAGFVVSNVIDQAAYSELLLDNLTAGSGASNFSFELGDYINFTLLGDSFGEVTWSVAAYGGTVYNPTQGEFLSHQCCFETGIGTGAWQNAFQQPGTVGSILETAVSLPPGGRFTFDWAFLAGDQSPYNDFALFYLKDASGKIVLADGLAQIGNAPAKPPLPPIIGILGSGLLSLRGLPPSLGQLMAKRQGAPAGGWPRWRRG
jgi:hypothetical protein